MGETNAWISESGEPRFIGHKNQYFWNKIVEDEWFSKAINVWIIHLNEEPVSYVISIDTKESRYVYANSYVKHVENFSTGTKLYYELILHAISCGKKMINFGLGDSGYKTQWGARASSVLIDLFAFPPTLKGRLAYYIFKLKTFLDI